MANLGTFSVPAGRTVNLDIIFTHLGQAASPYAEIAIAAGATVIVTGNASITCPDTPTAKQYTLTVPATIPVTSGSGGAALFVSMWASSAKQTVVWNNADTANRQQAIAALNIIGGAQFSGFSAGFR